MCVFLSRYTLYCVGSVFGIIFMFSKRHDVQVLCQVAQRVMCRNNTDSFIELGPFCGLSSLQST